MIALVKSAFYDTIAQATIVPTRSPITPPVITTTIDSMRYTMPIFHRLSPTHLRIASSLDYSTILAAIVETKLKRLRESTMIVKATDTRFIMSVLDLNLDANSL